MGKITELMKGEVLCIIVDGWREEARKNLRFRCPSCREYADARRYTASGECSWCSEQKEILDVDEIIAVEKDDDKPLARNSIFRQAADD